jgi:hypothetical protein
MNNKELVLFTSSDGNITIDVQLKTIQFGCRLIN